MAEIYNRKLATVPRNEDAEKAFILDYVAFALPSRFYCVKALHDVFKNELVSVKKSALSVGMSNQSLMALEDMLQICTALKTVSQSSGKHFLHEEIARKYKKIKTKETAESIINKTFLIDIGLNRKGKSNKHLKDMGLNQDAINRQWKLLIVGLEQFLKLYTEFIEDMNRVKHGIAVVSNPQVFNPDADKKHETCICTLYIDGKTDECELFSFLDITNVEGIENTVKQTMMIVKNSLVLVLWFYLQKYLV